MSFNHQSVPMGMKFFREIPDADLPVLKVRSFCEALGLLREGRYPEGFLLTEDSINVCVWSSVALGFRDPKDDIDGVVPIRFHIKNKAVYIFNAQMDSEGHPLAESIDYPDVVTLLASRETMENLVVEFGPDKLSSDYLGQAGYSANHLYMDSLSGNKDLKLLKKRERNILSFNRFFSTKFMRSFPVLSLMSSMMKRRWMQKFMNYICLNHTSAMGMCYSASTFPMTNGKANVTFSDPGAVGWGGFDPEDMTIGMPGEMYREMKSRIDSVLESNSRFFN